MVRERGQRLSFGVLAEFAATSTSAATGTAAPCYTLSTSEPLLWLEEVPKETEVWL